MNPLLMLLGQQAGVPVAEDTANEIVVTRERGVPRARVDYGDYSLNNEDAVAGRADDIRKTEEASQRRGLFGMKGTLRDVLGVLGDAFLIQGGNAPIYAPIRRQERISDAMAGFTEDPVAAAERVGYYDPKIGEDLYNNYETNLIRKAQAESLAASRDVLNEDRRFKMEDNARKQIGALFNTPGAVVNGQINPKALALAENIARSAGKTLEDFLISDQMTEQEVRDYAMSVLDPYKQERLEDYDVGLQQGQQNADSRAASARASMIRAQRPPAGRNPPQPTEAAEIARIRGKLNRGESLSPGDQATWNKYTSSGSTRSGSRQVPRAGTIEWTIRPKGQ